MNYRDFRQIRQQRGTKERRGAEAPRQDQRLLHTVHLKTIENRTLMETLRHNLTQEKFDELIVDYAIRLRKARTNFRDNNFSKELDIVAYEAELEERNRR